MAVTQHPILSRPAGITSQESEQGPLRFFISYKRDDQYVADCLVKILRSIDASITCFFDQDIAEGNQWAEQINRELRRCNRLILLYTGNEKNYETCVYEVATFQALHFNDSPDADTDAVICLHDTKTVPTTFRAYQNCKIMTPQSEFGQTFARQKNLSKKPPQDFYLASPCGQFLKRLTERFHGTIPLDTDKILEQLIASRAEEIAQAFEHASDPVEVDKVMYPRMWLELDGSTIKRINEGELKTIPDETIVRADDNPNALNIFGLDTTKATWGQVRAQCQPRSRSGIVGWMAEAEAALIAVVRGETVRAIELGFRSIDTRSDPDVYRCLLTRRINYRSGRQLLYLLFVRSRNRKLANDDVMALYLALLVMTTRFRFEVLRGEWSFRFPMDPESFKEQSQRFLNLIEKAEYEATEFGIMNSLENAFTKSDQKKIENIATLWEKDLGELEKSLKNGDEDLTVKRKKIVEFMEAWRPRNGEFLEMVLSNFSRRLQAHMQADARPE